MRDSEEVFVRSFVRRDKRERILQQLASKNGRVKFRRRLAHDFLRDLDDRFVFEVRSLQAPVTQQVEKMIAGRERTGQLMCYLISESDELDGSFIPFKDFQCKRNWSEGTIIILDPEHIAYYKGEDNEPEYILLRIGKI